MSPVLYLAPSSANLWQRFFPLHLLLALLLLIPAPAWSAVPLGGADLASPAPLAPAEPTPPSSPPAAGATAGASGAAPELVQGTAPGLAPELEALLREDAAALGDRREAQAATTGSDGGSGSPGVNTVGSADGAASPSSPDVDAFTGSARVAIPILVPPGRGAATPDLRLAYSSGAGDSAFGHGWTLPLGYIARRAEHHVPACPLDEKDQARDFVFNIDGRTREILQAWSFPSGDAVYMTPRPIDQDDRYWRLYPARSANHWVAYDRAGNRYTFGDVPSARLFSGADVFYNTKYNENTGANCQFTTKWMLTSFTDANGNELKYSYFKDYPGINAIYLERIDYGGNSKSASLREAPFRIAFDRSISLINHDRGTPFDNPKIHPWSPWTRSISYARGVLERRYYVIHGIRILYRPSSGAAHKLIRQYRLDYQDDPYTGRNLLQRVRTLGPTGQQLVPPQTFTYSSSHFDFAPETTLATPFPSQDKTRLAFTNAAGQQWRGRGNGNGDAYVDLIDTQQGWMRLGTNVAARFNAFFIPR